MLNLQLQATYIFTTFSEDEEAPVIHAIKFYADASMLGIIMYHDDPEQEGPVRLPHIPSSVEEGVEWYQQRYDVQLHEVVAEMGLGKEEEQEEEKVAEANEESDDSRTFTTLADPHVAKAELEASTLAYMIDAVIMNSRYSGDYKATWDGGKIHVEYGSARAVIEFGLLR